MEGGKSLHLQALFQVPDLNHARPGVASIMKAFLLEVMTSPATPNLAKRLGLSTLRSNATEDGR